MKVSEIKTEDENMIFELSMSKSEETILKEVCEKNNITIEEFVNLCLKFMIDNPDEAFKFIKEHRSDKCPKGILGKPLFKYEDEVGFYIKPYNSDKEIFCKGKVYIVDAYGTFEQNNEPSYDIMVENYNNTGQPCLVKHIRESSIYTMKH